MAEPSRLYNPTMHKKLVGLIADGHTMTAAAGMCGINVSTLRGWLNHGRKQEGGAFDDFAADVELALGQARAKIEAVAVKLATEVQQTKRVSTEIITETRLDNDGNQYEYRRKTKKIEIAETPIDWRAPFEYLKRRAPDDWQNTPMSLEPERPKIRVTNPTQAFMAIAPKSVRDKEGIVEAEIEDES